MEAAGKPAGHFLKTCPFAGAELELVRAASDEIAVDVAFVLVHAEVASADELLPVLTVHAWSCALQISGVECAHADFGDDVLGPFVGFNVDRDDDNIRLAQVGSSFFDVQSFHTLG